MNLGGSWVSGSYEARLEVDASRGKFLLFEAEDVVAAVEQEEGVHDCAVDEVEVRLELEAGAQVLFVLVEEVFVGDGSGDLEAVEEVVLHELVVFRVVAQVELPVGQPLAAYHEMTIFREALQVLDELALAVLPLEQPLVRLDADVAGVVEVDFFVGFQVRVLAEALDDVLCDWLRQERRDHFDRELRERVAFGLCVSRAHLRVRGLGSLRCRSSSLR